MHICMLMDSILWMSQHDLVLILHEDSLPTIMTHTKLVEAFGFLIILYTTVTKIIRQMS
jgi:hypothetical protein